MKFIVSSGKLLKQIQVIAGVLNSNSTLPILDNILFEVNDKNQLTLSASDLETTMIAKMEVKSQENFLIAIPAKLLLDTLKAFPDQPLTFSIDENKQIEISSDFGKYQLSGYNGAEFPKVPEVDSPSSVLINAEVLSNAVHKTIFATGNDDLRPVMSGVFCEFSPEGVIFVATDAHKLVKYTRSDTKAKAVASFIIPKKPLSILKGIMSTTNADVTIEYNELNASFRFDNLKVVCRLIDGEYPNYDAVIPKENPNKLTIGRQDLLNSIKRVSIFSNKTTHQVRLKMMGSELSISAEDVDFSNAANERLTCSYDGEDMEIGFNSRFVIDMLSNIDSDNVILEMSASNRAGILLPEKKASEHEDVLMLVMPVMLNN
jgi:DNA polymerase-3 subunit beta